eukprot:TRINITY_DN112712_c0_g1_i1.p1 TRINITY_DN112712_c0_g1~~TRINITY_DN112712_c0_g1_i1.p1  ORF type:complete len:322 (+),score=53.46 TRINITY_DN112712_c0_g1_i1:125-1090(+)
MTLTWEGRYHADRFGTLWDAQCDCTGKRLATASNDGVIRVWSLEKQQVVGECIYHQTAALCVSWGSGNYAGTLASAASNGQVIIWREVRGEFQLAHMANMPGGAVSALAFCPSDYGLMLAVGCGDGQVAMVTAKIVSASPVLPSGEQWQVRFFHAHQGPVRALSWAPSSSPATLAAGPAASRAPARGPRRLVTTGDDGGLHIWRCEEKLDAWTVVQSIRDRAGPASSSSASVRDVAWRPNVGIPTSLVALCTEAGDVETWVQDMEGQPWRQQAAWKVSGDARRLAWSEAGNVLAISVGEAACLLYREGPLGEWSQVSSMES